MFKDRTKLILLALGGAFAILTLAPILPMWFTGALGAVCGGASDSLWRLWSSSNDFSGVGFPSAPTTQPVAAPFVAVVFHVLMAIFGGAIPAWNAMILLGYVCLIWGTIALAKRIAPNAPLLGYITFVLAVVGSAAWAPLLHGAGVDILPLMLVPSALALLHKWLEPQASTRIGVAAALVFLFSVLGHWSASVFVIAMTVPMAMVMNRHWEGIQARNRTFFALGPGIVLGAWHIYSTAADIPGIDVSASAMAPAWVTHMSGAFVLPASIPGDSNSRLGRSGSASQRFSRLAPLRHLGHSVGCRHNARICPTVPAFHTHDGTVSITYWNG